MIYLLIRHCTFCRILDIKSFTLIIIIITYGSNRNIKGLDWLLLGVKWLIKWKDHAKNLRKFRLRHFRCVLDATLRMTNGQTDQSLQPPPLACLRVDDPESLDNFWRVTNAKMFFSGLSHGAWTKHILNVWISQNKCSDWLKWCVWC